MTLDERHIPLAGSRNFRDFGGYPTACGRKVKRGQLFRSDGLWKLSDDDLTTLMPLGIRNICDLRRLKERELMPTRWHDGYPVNNRHLPLIPDEGRTTIDKVRVQQEMHKSAESARQVMIDVYRSMVVDELALSNLRRIFQLIATDGELPVLIHCSGGKDRTGVSCGLILLLLGVDRQDVVEDYMHSQVLYSDKVDLNRAATQVFDHKASGEWDIEAVRPVYNVDPVYLGSALDYIRDHFGEVDNFARQALGLSDDDIEQIRRNLIE